MRVRVREVLLIKIAILNPFSSLSTAMYQNVCESYVSTATSEHLMQGILTTTFSENISMETAIPITQKELIDLCFD